MMEAGLRPQVRQPERRPRRPGEQERRAPSAGTIDDFRAFVARQGAEVPEGAAADAPLEVLLLRSVVTARWGAAEYYRIAAVLDDAVAAAIAAFPAAASLSGNH